MARRCWAAREVSVGEDTPLRAGEILGTTQEEFSRALRRSRIEGTKLPAMPR